MPGNRPSGARLSRASVAPDIRARRLQFDVSEFRVAGKFRLQPGFHAMPAAKRRGENSHPPRRLSALSRHDGLRGLGEPDPKFGPGEPLRRNRPARLLRGALAAPIRELTAKTRGAGAFRYRRQPSRRHVAWNTAKRPPRRPCPAPSDHGPVGRTLRPMSEIAARPLDPDATPVRRSPASRRIKVLVLIPDLAIGGAETDLLRTLPLIDRDRLEVVVCVIEARGALAAPLSEAGIQVIGPFVGEAAEAKPLDRALLRIDAMTRRLALGWPVFRLMRLALHYMRVARMVKRVLDEGRFDVVHTMSPSSYVIGALATGFARHRALVMSRVSLNFYQHGARLLGTVERLLHRRVDLAIANAEAILRELAAWGFPASRLRWCRNG